MPHANPEEARVYHKRWRKKKMDRLRAHFGGECVKCGGTNRLEFHHRDTKEKSFNVAGAAGAAWDKLVAEAEKCDLLCLKHHKDFHGRARHGTVSRYTNQGCKCALCCEAMRKYDRARPKRVSRSSVD